MRAKFIGRDGSCGLEHGRVYDVLLQESNKRMFVYMYWIDIHDDELASCPYQSMDTLLNNWEFVEEWNGRK